MNIFSFAPRVLASFLAFGVSVSWAAEPIIPAAPQLAAKSYVLMDAPAARYWWSITATNACLRPASPS